MTDKLIIPFEGRTDKDIDGGGVVVFIGFGHLRKILEARCDCKENEVIAGFLIDKTGITIKIERVNA